MTENPAAAAARALRAEWHQVPAGARLPSDRAIAERFGIGRGVVGRIMAEFEREGLVRRRNGAGTYWLGAPEVVPATTVPSFSVVMRNGGVTPGFTPVGHEARRAAAPERELLELPANSMVWKIQRIFTVDDVPVGFATSILPMRDLTALPGEQETYGSLFETLRRRYRLNPVRVWKRRRPIVVPRFVGEALGLEQPVPFRLEESLNRAVDGTPIEYARTFMRDDALSCEALMRRARGRKHPFRQEAYCR